MWRSIRLISAFGELIARWLAITGRSDGRRGAGGCFWLGLFTALQEQLGLKLDATKGMVDTIVIDSVEMPSEN